MGGKKLDQRIRLTRMLLKDALVRLLEEKHISKISVRELCELAGINRSTFYAHYRDPFDLLAKIEQEVLQDLRNYLEAQSLDYSNPIPIQVLTSILDYFKANQGLIGALFSENSDQVFQKELLSFAQVTSARTHNALDDKTQTYIEAFAVTGIISLLQTWLRSGMQERSEQMARFIVRLLYGGIADIGDDLAF